MSFEASHPSLLRALTDRGYSDPTPVQAAVLEPQTANRDLLVSAQTGSGKTIAYGLTIASTLLGAADRFRPGGQPLALIVAPTRELAMQVHKELSWLFVHTQAALVSCVGGIDIRQDQRALARGAHIVVGTPGRLCDHIESGVLKLTQLKAVVLDEADEMLDMGFRDELERILAAVPAERRTLLFSATIPKQIVALTRKYQRDALRIALSTRNEPHGDIEYRALLIGPHDHEHAIVNVLRYFDVRGALAFCSTRDAVRHLHANLMERGFAAVALSGELSQSERTRALHALRDGRARVCVATDVAARGLDLPDLGLVIHADLPQNMETLVHRSGRTGRAGKKGLCVVLVPPQARRRAERLFAGAHIDAQWGPPPAADEIRARDQQKLVREISAMADGAADEDLATARLLLAERSPEDIAAVLVRMHRGLMPAPEELRPAQPHRAESRDFAAHGNAAAGTKDRRTARPNQKGGKNRSGVRPRWPG
ncbi:MAG TPA: DEAD/DEAH box helicase [Bryobacteraceae bacterium]|nr:DEAD/DEAH box helicase [Bryobacteraceae bacterium]